MFDAAEARRPLDDLRTTALIGLGVMGLAVLLGLTFARAVARRIQAMAGVARQLATLDVANVVRQPDNRIAEFAEAADAFNALTAGLRWFETYVPKSLVLRLMRRGAEATTSMDRTLTVMFTDNKGFSTMAERQQAGEIATLLNRHFEIISGCIDAEDGTVDKFIGDSVMAFWGAPESMPDHAARAVRAAAAIQVAMADENRDRHARGDEPICIRIGPAYRTGGGGQHRLEEPRQLHGCRRHGKRRLAARIACQRNPLGYRRRGGRMHRAALSRDS